MVRTVIEELIENVSMKIGEIRQAHRDGDLDLVLKRAHAIKGGAATAEATVLATAAADLEDLCKKGGGDIAPTIERLIGAFDDLKLYADAVSW